MLTRRRSIAAGLLPLTLAALVACAEEPTQLDGTTGSGAGTTGSVTGGGPGSGGGTGEGGAGATSGSGATGTTGATASAGPTTTTTGSGGAGGEAPQEATFELSLDDGVPVMELRAQLDLTLSIAANGYVGPVALSFDGAPSDVDVALDAPTVELTGSGSETVGLTITTASDTVSGAFALVLSGTVPTGTKETAAVVTVEPVLTILIPAGLNGMGSNPPNTTAFGDYPTVIRALPAMSADNPVTINFFNGDSVAHQIHASNPDQGFGHGIGDIQPGTMDSVVRRVTAPGTYNYYPHDIGQTILGRIVIE